MIEYFGYPAETHKVTTQDGYILELHRIPHGIVETEGPRTPVMVQHGLFSSSADFVINFPNQSLGNDTNYECPCSCLKKSTLAIIAAKSM